MANVDMAVQRQAQWTADGMEQMQVSVHHGPIPQMLRPLAAPTHLGPDVDWDRLGLQGLV